MRGNTTMVVGGIDAPGAGARAPLNTTSSCCFREGGVGARVRTIPSKAPNTPIPNNIRLSQCQYPIPVRDKTLN